MRANLDPTVEIEEENRHCYHLEVQSRAIDPNRPLDPIIRKRILCLRPIDYKKYFQCSAKEQSGYLEAMNLRDCRLVHDPTKEEVVKVERIVSAEEEHRDARKIVETLKSPTSKTKRSVKK
jgi:hypothetical protein